MSGHAPDGLHIMINLLHAQETLTGTGHYARELIRALLALPEKPLVTAICSPFNHKSFDLPEKKRYRRVVWGHSWRSTMARRVEEWARLHGEIRRRKPDVFFCPSNFLPLVRTPVPYVVTVHDMTFFRHPDALSPMRRRYWHAWTRRTVKVADSIITGATAAREDIVRYCGVDVRKITVIPHGVAPEYLIAGDRGGREERRRQLLRRFADLPENYLLFLGTLTIHKNVPRLIEAVARARSRDCRDLHLVLAGKRGEGYDRITQAIARANLAGAVHELGYVEDRFMPALYENARAQILPSFTEGFGLPIVEAMACGTPVLTSREGAMREVAGPAAEYFDPLDGGEMAAAIANVWSSAERRMALREAGLERVAEFTWAAAARRTHEVLARAAGR